MKKDMFDALMETSTDSIVFEDSEGRYVEVSHKKAANWDIEPKDIKKNMIGKTDFDFMDPEEAQRARKDSLRVIETGQPIVNERRPGIRNGEPIWNSLSQNVWLYDSADGKKRGTVGITRNITDQVEYEQKCLAMSQQILDMVKIVSHDLCSPLITISAIAKGIMNGRHGEISPEVRKAVTEIFKRLLKQRAAILDYLYMFSNLNGEDQEIETEELDLRSDVIDEVLEELDEMIQDNKSIIDDKLGLIPAGAVKIISNKVILKIVYRNLLTNALKHGGSGCIISFGFEEFSNRFEFNVFDDGPPVPDDESGGLFEPFIQGKSVVKGNGLGIGLNTIRNMIRNLGGDLWHKTTWSNHPNFIFTLPKPK